MVSAEVIKGVNQLLVDARRPTETRRIIWGFRRARIGDKRTTIGGSAERPARRSNPEEAVLKTGIEPARVDQDLLRKVARLIGAALGSIASKIS